MDMQQAIQALVGQADDNHFYIHLVFGGPPERNLATSTMDEITGYTVSWY